jgi:hypothetical protein
MLEVVRCTASSFSTKDLANVVFPALGFPKIQHVDESIVSGVFK